MDQYKFYDPSPPRRYYYPVGCFFFFFSFLFWGKNILILRGICMLNFKLIRLLKITLLGEATGLL